jgi:hypothetical protein
MPEHNRSRRTDPFYHACKGGAIEQRKRAEEALLPKRLFDRFFRGTWPAPVWA